MNERERSHPETPQSGPAAAGGTDGSNLNAIHATGAALLSAAEEAISRVLSGDSLAFNQAVRQEGGQ